VEDPIEYELPGIGQTQVNPKIDLDFAKALRAILRQDPDVIMIGEIRDYETAQIAIQASLTGHLVLATLHTNDAPSAIARLIDIGMEPYLVTSTLLATMAQRLLRRLCQTCHGTGKGTETGPWGDRCEKCFGTGFFGRIGVFEIMRMTDELRVLTIKNTDAVTLAQAARASGMRTMMDDAMDKIAAGLTTEAEANRVLR
jgi:general secretion pathway protein E